MFEQLVKKLPVGICVIDEQYAVKYLNAFFLDRMPAEWRSFYQGQSLFDLFPEQASFLKRRIKSVFVLQHPSFSYWEQRPHLFPFKSSRPITGEETQMFQNLEIVPIPEDEEGNRLACLFLQDVTAQASYFNAQKALSQELKDEHEAQQKLIRKLDTAQSQLIQAEKMASMGQLAAGVAHEINNPISFVQANLATLKGYAESLLDMSESLIEKLSISEDAQVVESIKSTYHFDLLKDDISPLIGESSDGLNRVRDIVLNLKKFALDEHQGWQRLNIHTVCEQIVQLVEAQYKAPIFKVSCSPEQLQIICDPGTLKQALLDIVINAAQSIDEKGVVKVEIKELNGMTSIKVIDSGCGIPAKHIKKIFDPFFTTRPEGEGKGLGLSVAYSAVEKHNGTIRATSHPGRGTVIDITLPHLSGEGASGLAS